MAGYRGFEETGCFCLGLSPSGGVPTEQGRPGDRNGGRQGRRGGVLPGYANHGSQVVERGNPVVAGGGRPRASAAHASSPVNVGGVGGMCRSSDAAATRSGDWLHER